MKPRRPAMNGLANFSRYSASRAAILAGIVLLVAEDDLHGALRAHHGDLRRRPREVDVAAQVLGAHHVVRAAVGLARDHRHLRHRAFGVRVQQLRAVLDDAAVLLRGAGHEAGHVDERDDRDAERVAEADEARRLDRALDVEAAREHQRLVGDDADRRALHPAEADHDVLRAVGLQLEEIAVVDGLDDQLLHVVRLVRVVRHQRVERHLEPVGRIVGPPQRRRDRGC